MGKASSLLKCLQQGLPASVQEYHRPFLSSVPQLKIWPIVWTCAQITVGLSGVTSSLFMDEAKDKAHWKSSVSTWTVHKQKDGASWWWWVMHCHKAALGIPITGWHFGKWGTLILWFSKLWPDRRFVPLLNTEGISAWPPHFTKFAEKSNLWQLLSQIKSELSTFKRHFRKWTYTQQKNIQLKNCVARLAVYWLLGGNTVTGKYNL